MNWRERIHNDGTDRASWKADRHGYVGASDAAKFAKEASIDLYVLGLLKSGNFTGNGFTASGNTWEPRMLNWFGIPQNLASIYDEAEPHFTATPDGIEVLPSGEIILAECKAKHDRVVTKPTPAELRQMYWAQGVIGPEARRTKFIWQEIVDGGPRRLEPHILIIERDQDAIDSLRKIGRQVLDKYLRALDFERQLAA